jgi:4'-phosphopantetheinyl transferase
MPERLDADEVHVWTAPLDLPPERLEHMLGADERERADRLRMAVRRRFVARRGLRRCILAAYTNQAPEQLRFAHGPHGKPELAGEELRFSCSSSGDLALVAVARGRRVGIDVERLRPVADALGIARSLLASEEHTALLALSGAERDAAFLRAWTRIEARVKVCGAGLAMAVDGAVARSPGPWSVRSLRPGPEHIGALAAEGSDWHVAWRSW